MTLTGVNENPIMSQVTYLSSESSECIKRVTVTLALRIDLNGTVQIHWVPGHKGFEPNEKADEEAKKAARGSTSETNRLPACLRRKGLPASVLALRQENRAALDKRWARRWRDSPRCRRLRSIDNTIPSRKFLRLISGLNRRQATIMTQLRTDHFPLNKYLFRIKRSDTPACPHCRGIVVETIHHFLFNCPHYRRERHILQTKLKRKAGSLSYLLSNAHATIPLLAYIHATGRLKTTFGPLV